MNAKIIDCFVTSKAVFYKLDKKVDMASLFAHPLNSKESQATAQKSWHTEQHWLADWGKDVPFEGYYEGCIVSFDIRSSRYYRQMQHGSTGLKNVRNIIADNIRLLS